MKWACPRCGAEPEKHGKGGESRCNYDSTPCYGFVCECERDTDDETHGTTREPCPVANCHHCGWGGTFPLPPPKFDPKKLRGWAKTAWGAGWRPPTGWSPSARVAKGTL